MTPDPKDRIRLLKVYPHGSLSGDGALTGNPTYVNPAMVIDLEPSKSKENYEVRYALGDSYVTGYSTRGDAEIVFKMV